MALWVSILPDTSKIVSTTKRALDNGDYEITVHVDKAELDKEVAKTKKTVESLDARVKLAVDQKRTHDAFQKAVDKELSRVRPLRIDVDRKYLTSTASFITKTLGGAMAGALGGLAITGAAGGLTALTGAIMSASGAFGLLPATAGGAATAIGALKVATLGFGDAMKDVGDPQKFAKAIADLSPNARETATAIQSMLPQLKDFKNAVQDRFFDGFAAEVKSLGAIYLPMMQGAMGSIAGSANNALRSVSALLKAPQSVSDMAQITGNSATAFNTLSQALTPIVKSMLDIGSVGSTFLPQLAQGANNAANSFAKFVTNARETGRMQEWMQTGIHAMGQLGDIAGNLGSTIAGIFRAGNDVGGGFLASLQTVTQTMSDFVNSAEGKNALGAFFSGAKDALAALSPILKTVGESVIGTVLPAFTNLGTAAAPALQAIFTNLAEVMKTLAPVVTSLSGPISTLLNAIGPAVVQTIQALAPAIQPLAQAFADLVAGAAPILPVLGQLVGAVVGALAPALSTLFKALAPVVSALADALKPVLDQLAPVLAAVAGTFANAWASALQQVTPLLPPLLGAMGDLLKTVIPLLPPLAELGAAAIPAIAAAIKVVAPLFTGLVKVLTPIVDTVITPMVGGFKALADVIGTVANGLSGVVDKASGFLSRVPGLGGIFGKKDGGPIGDVPGYAGGGKITGRGSGTSDSILAWLSNGEGVMTAAAMRNGGAPILAALNAGWVPPAAMLHAMIPGFAQGLNPGADFLRTTIMRQWPQIGDIGGRRAEDGYGEHSSGNALDVMVPGWDTPEGILLGNQVAGFLAKNREQLGLDGFIWRQTSYGYGGSFTDGKAMSDRGSPTQNHMDHLHVMLGKGRGSGAAAVGLPTSSISLPSASGMSSSGGTSGRGSGAAGARRVREAQDRVSDRNFDVQQAQAALDELNAKDPSKVTRKQRNAAEHRLERSKREQAQANDDLTQTQNEYNDAMQNSPLGGNGNSAASDLGSGLIDGLFQGLGFDGSLFSDPRQWGLVKMFTGLLGGKGGSSAGDLGQGGGGMLNSMGLPSLTGLFSRGQTSTVTAENVMPGGGPGGLIAGIGDIATNAFQQGMSQPTTIDNSINLNGNQGMDPQAVQTSIQKKQNERTRTYATAGLGA
ncbi:tail tape measure protein [Mycobacteroides immunogenum]|uniref:Tail tape measure protein n=2 Tax=Mycobacteroides immunogenum TaxID=83262 RepID=A0A7V8LJV4_9MYCO|nr:tail tape measure protein [Mycobacteroides immunogenum]ANO05114.1 tail tape measure protein [Mycobacteroides immunogenum]KIU40213.1 tail tape measure protein [Mycobacteroides immunogenum]KPG02879.1 tail tape measure protein [Mycobacteroides immunogenum]KPG02965.1 tail tape measure protein [Mycobacteroides immunogenum]